MLMREVMQTRRKKGWCCSGYNDNQLHTHQEVQVHKKHRLAILDLLDRETTMLGKPLQCIKYLGMMVDTQVGVFIVPDDLCACLLEGVRLAVENRHIQVRTLASIKGQIVSMPWALGPASRLYT